MTTYYGIDGLITWKDANGQEHLIRDFQWSPSMEIEVIPFDEPVTFTNGEGLSITFHCHQTRRQAIAARRLFGLPTSLHRREKRRARKRGRK